MKEIQALGRGSFSSVVSASDPKGNLFAIKRLSHTPFGSFEKALKHAILEGATLSRLSSPHIARVRSVGTSGDTPYLVMELVQGASLAQELEKRRSPSTEATGTIGLNESDWVELAKGLADALREIHSLGLVHRDIKPENVLLDGGSFAKAKLIDFGLALRSIEQDQEEVSSESAVGTLSYASPEQTRMLSRPVDARSDLYALGILLYECETGRLPFVSDRVAELLRMHLSETPTDLRTLRPTFPLALISCVDSLIAKDPDDRFQSAEALLEFLNHWSTRASDPVSRRDRGVPVFPEPPFVGRNQELSQIQETVVSGFSKDNPQHGILLISGPPGAGKSRLVRELLHFAQQHGAWTFQGKCSLTDSTSLSSIQQAIDRFLLEVELLPASQKESIHQKIKSCVLAQPIPALIRRLGPGIPLLLEKMGSPLGDLPPSIQQERMLELLANFIVNLADNTTPCIWLIDDIQWLDDLSSRLLTRIQEASEARPLLWACTSRDNEESRTALRAFEEKHSASIRVNLSLELLHPEATRELIVKMLGENRIVPDELLDYVVGLSQGSPFATHEYIRAMLDNALLVPKSGTWKVDMQGIQGLHLSGDVLALVTRRLSTLAPEALAILKVAAVIGNQFDLRELPKVCGVEPSAINSAITEASSKTLIAHSTSGDWLFVHDRVREALIAQWDPEDLKKTHWKLALSLFDRLSEILTPLAKETDNLFGHVHPALAAKLSTHEVMALADHSLAGLAHTEDAVWCFERLRESTWFAKSQSDHALIEDLGGRTLTLARKHLNQIDAEKAARLCWVTGSSLAILGKLTAASEIFELGLNLSRDPLTRASLSSQYSYVALWRYDSPTLEKRSLATLAEFGIHGHAGVWLQMKLAAHMVSNSLIHLISPSSERVRKMELIGLAFETLGIAMAYQLRSIPALLSVPAALSLLFSPIRNDIKGNLAGIVLIGSRIFESEFPVGMIAEAIAKKVDSKEGDQT